MGTTETETGGKLIRAPWLAIGLAGWLGAVTSASADFYQFTFSGVIDAIDGDVPEPWDSIHIGSVFEYSYVFDSEAEDQIGNPQYGLYYAESASVSIDGVPQTTDENRILVIDELFDRYETLFTGLPNGANGGISLSGWEVLDSDEIPLDLNLGDWTGATFKFTGTGSDGIYEVSGLISTFDGRIVSGAGTLAVMPSLLLCTTRRRR